MCFKRMSLWLRSMFSLSSCFNLAEAKGKLSGAGLYDCLLNYMLTEGRGTMFLFILVILGTQSLVFNRNMVFGK